MLIYHIHSYSMCCGAQPFLVPNLSLPMPGIIRLDFVVGGYFCMVIQTRTCLFQFNHWNKSYSDNFLFASYQSQPPYNYILDLLAVWQQVSPGYSKTDQTSSNKWWKGLALERSLAWWENIQCLGTPTKWEVPTKTVSMFVGWKKGSSFCWLVGMSDR